MTRLLCTSDWQLGVPTVSLDEQEQVAHRIVDLAIDSDVDLFLHGGDVFEGRGSIIYPEQIAAFRRPLNRLRQAGIPVIVTLGNGTHDQAQRPVSGLDVFDDVPGVHVSRRPEIVEAGWVHVVTLPWVSRGWLAARVGDVPLDELHAVMAEQLIEVARGLRADLPDDATAVLLGHWGATGSLLPTGLPFADHATEPILPLDELETLGFDAVILGHVHRGQLLSTGALTVNSNGSHVVEAPTRILHPGSPMPLNHGEAGCEHGVWILDTTGGLDFHPIQSRRFLTIEEDMTAPGAGALAVPWATTYDLDGAIVRVRYTATPEQARRIDQAALRAALTDAGAHRVSFEPTIIREQRARLAGLDHNLSEGEAFDRWLDHTHDGLTVERRRVICDRFHHLLENTA